MNSRIFRAGSWHLLIRFLLVGALNTAFGLGVYAGLIHIGLPIWAALIGGNLAGIVFNFFTTGSLVFSEVSLTRLPRFIGVYLMCYILNYLSLSCLVALHVGVIRSQVFISPIIAVTSFHLMSRYVFAFRTSSSNERRR